MRKRDLRLLLARQHALSETLIIGRGDTLPPPRGLEPLLGDDRQERM